MINNHTNVIFVEYVKSIPLLKYSLLSINCFFLFRVKKNTYNVVGILSFLENFYLDKFIFIMLSQFRFRLRDVLILNVRSCTYHRFFDLVWRIL